jgi:U3 small nucleolar RNA-associated protein 13
MSSGQDLKEANDGLSKVWKVHDKHEPFYTGGHVEVILSTPSAPSSSSHSSNSGNNSVSTLPSVDILACLYDENIKLMNWNTGQLITTLLPEEDEARERVSVFCMHPTGMELVLATATGLLRHYSTNHNDDNDGAKHTNAKEVTKEAINVPITALMNTWVCVRAIKAHTMPVLAMAYDPTGTLVATGSADRLVKVWDVARGYCTHSFKGHTDIVHSVRFHIPASYFTQDNKSGKAQADVTAVGSNLQLYSTAQDCTVKVYDLNDSKCVATHKQHLSAVTAVATASSSGDEYLLVSVGRDKVRERE